MAVNDITGKASSEVVLWRISVGVLWNPTLLIQLVSEIFYIDKQRTYRVIITPDHPC